MQGPLIQMMKLDSFSSGSDSMVTLNDHHARISCMRSDVVSTPLFHDKPSVL